MTLAVKGLMMMMMMIVFIHLFIIQGWSVCDIIGWLSSDDSR